MAFYLSRAVACSNSRRVCLSFPKLRVLGTERVPSGVSSVLALPTTVHSSVWYLSCNKLSRGSIDSGSFLPELNAKSKRQVRVSPGDEPIVQQISEFEFSSTSELLSFLETIDTNDLDHRAIEVISRVLWETLKNERNESMKKLLNSFGMQLYCRSILKTCGTMDGRLLVALAKVLVFMGANGNHKTFQTLLDLISKRASKLELSQIVFLEFLINSLRPEQTSTLSEAIRKVLPVVFESQLTSQLDDAGPKELINFLAFSIFTKSKDGTVTKIIDKILSLRPADLSLAQAVDIHKLLGHCRPIPGLQSLLELSYGIFMANMHMIDESQMSLLLERSARRVNRGLLEFYHNDFIDACCSRLVDSRNEILVLRSLATISSLRHLNIDFLERCAEIAARVPQRIANDDSLLFALMRGFSNACYRPENWNTLQPMLLEHPATTKEISHQEISLIIYYLALDTLPLNLLERVFCPDYFGRLNAFLHKSGPFSLTVIYAAIKQLYPEYSGPLPPKSMIDAWQKAERKRMAAFRHPVEGSLISAFGGESYVLTGCVHKGIHIDHCIVMRKGGYAVAMEQCQYSCLDEIERPKGSTLILVKVFRVEAYSMNTRRLRGIYSVESKILKSFGHPVVEVDLMAWRSLTEAEKLPFLVQKVRENVDKIPI